MKRPILTFFAFLLEPLVAFAAQPASAKPDGDPTAGMRAKPIHIEIDAPVPHDLPSELMLQNDEAGGYAVTFLIRGRGLTGLNGRSLRITSATVAGTDISKDESGQDSWSFGPFPHVSEDGTSATFEVRVSPGAKRVKSGVPVLHGSIAATSATGRETKIVTISTAPGSSAELGPVKVSIPAADDKGAKKPSQHAGGQGDGGNAEMATAIFGGMLGGGGEKGLKLEVTGDASSLASIVVVVDDGELEPRSWMNVGHTTYGFPPVKGDTVQVKADFWTGQRTETVSF